MEYLWSTEVEICQQEGTYYVLLSQEQGTTTTIPLVCKA